MLDPNKVTAIRQAAIALVELSNTKIETTDTAQAKVAAERVLIDAMMQPEIVLEFVSTWYAVHTEYVPFVRALAPVLQRVGQIQQAQLAAQAAMQQAQAQAKVASSPADSSPVGTTE